MNGQIVRIISDLYTVKIDNMLYGCRARGVFRNKGITPLVGDNCIVDTDKNIIVKILDRKNELKRPPIANVDYALIITSVKEPNLDLNLLDKLISIITYNNIEPVIVFTKLDLLTEEETNIINDLREYYELIGIKTFYNTETNNILKFIKSKVIVLSGQSGAGKSSLINRMNNTFDIKTDEISKALGRGKHTTRHVELYSYKNSFIVDTPGFSSLDIVEEEKGNIRFYFPEFDNDGCKFRDCKHINEIGCKIKEDVDNNIILKSRYDNYKKMVMGDENFNINN